MTENVSDLVLEGNSAVTLLQELFACEITIAQTQCEACGSIEACRLFASVWGSNGSSSKMYPIAMAFSCGRSIHRMAGGSK